MLVHVSQPDLQEIKTSWSVVANNCHSINTSTIISFNLSTWPHSMQSWGGMWSWLQDTRVWPPPRPCYNPKISAWQRHSSKWDEIDLSPFQKRNARMVLGVFAHTGSSTSDTFLCPSAALVLILQVTVETLLGSPPQNQVRFPSYNPGVPTEATFCFKSLFTALGAPWEKTWSPFIFKPLEFFLQRRRGLTHAYLLIEAGRKGEKDWGMNLELPSSSCFLWETELSNW